jgi:hypothetical protein
MTRYEAAAKIVDLYGELVAQLRYRGKTMPPGYTEAVAMACMALKEADKNG